MIEELIESYLINKADELRSNVRTSTFEGGTAKSNMQELDLDENISLAINTFATILTATSIGTLSRNGVGNGIKRRIRRKTAQTIKAMTPDFLKGDGGIIKNLSGSRLSKSQLFESGVSVKNYLKNTREMVYGDHLERLIYMSTALEEVISPMKIFRTLSATHVLRSIQASSAMSGEYIDPKMISGMYDYYSGAFEKYGNRRLDAGDLKTGLFYKDGHLYGGRVDPKGKVSINLGDKIVKALPVFTTFDYSGEGKSPYVNQIFRKHLIEEGIDPRSLDFYNSSKNKKVSFVMAKDSVGIIGKMLKGYTAKGLESGSRALDSFIDPIADLREGAGKKDAFSFFRLGSGRYSKKMGGMIYDDDMKTHVARLSKNIFGKVGLAYVGYAAVDYTLGKVFGEEYRPKQLLNEVAGQASLLYAKTYSDNMQWLRDKQEKVAPGSTEIYSSLGVVGGLFMAGATASYGKFIYDTVKKGYRAADLATKAARINISDSPIIKRIDAVHQSNLSGKIAAIEEKLSGVDKLGVKTGKGVPVISRIIKAEYSRGQRWGIVSGLVGLGLSLPTIPGALVGDDSETLKRKMEGKENVEVRRNRGWIMGGGDYAGEKVKYFDKHWYFKNKENIKSKELYGDVSGEYDLDPIISPFDYLKDPYRLEKRNKDNLVFPVWGMDVTYGGPLGEIFEATLGQIIKPNIVREDIYDENGKVKPSTPLTNNEKQLIESGRMTERFEPEVPGRAEGLKKAIIALADFAGFKGYVAQEYLVGNIGYRSPLLNENTLETSGSIGSAAITIKEANLGDIGFFGEAQRRMIPTGTDSMKGIIENPIENNAPSWLPGDDSGYYINFHRGNISSKVENSEFRAPGAGYAKLYPYLKDIDPEDYPLIHKYEILSDIALGSKEQVAAKRNIENKIKKGSISDYEMQIFERVERQTEKRREGKEFKKEQVEINTLLDKVVNKYWETLASASQSPIETLSPVRLGSKFIHYRDSTEDYKRNVLYGSDMALWSEPLAHFSKASIMQTADAFTGTSFDDGRRTKMAIDEYFDRTEYLKYRLLEKKAVEDGDIDGAKESRRRYLSTRTGVVGTGLNSNIDISKAKLSLQQEDRDYFESFLAEKDEGKRKKILEMIPHQDREIYTRLWENLDKERNGEVVEPDNPQEINKILKEKDLESIAYLSEAGGMFPQDSEVWDPLIEVKDVKLRFLQLAGENPREYGMWDKDEVEMARRTSILRDSSIKDLSFKVKELTKKYSDRSFEEFKIRLSSKENNLKVKDVKIESGNGNTTFVRE